MQVDVFVNRFKSIAGFIEELYKIPALVVLAQAALESGWGKSMPGNMVFGIKAKNWTGKKQLLTTTEYHTTNNVSYPEIISIEKVGDKYKYKVKDYFRAYDDPEDSFLDYAKFLVQNNRYSKAFNFNDPYLFAKEIAAAGYATSPTYYQKIKSIIDRIKKKFQPE